MLSIVPISTPFFKKNKDALRDAAPQEDDEDITCCICLEPIEECKMVSLRCCHKFHGQCLCDHLVHNHRCPICRDSPYDDVNESNYVEEDEEDEEETLPITFHEALAKARDAVAADKGTARTMKTICKWKHEMNKTKRMLQASRNKLKPLETALGKKMNTLCEKERDKFNAKNANLLNEHDMIRKQLVLAATQYRAARTRIAKKYGFTRFRRSSVRSRAPALR